MGSAKKVGSHLMNLSHLKNDGRTDADTAHRSINGVSIPETITTVHQLLLGMTVEEAFFILDHAKSIISEKTLVTS